MALCLTNLNYKDTCSFINIKVTHIFVLHSSFPFSRGGLLFVLEIVDCYSAMSPSLLQSPWDIPPFRYLILLVRVSYSFSWCYNLQLASRSVGFLDSSAGKESACKAGDLWSIPGSGSSPGEGIGSPLQCSCLENPHGQRRLVGFSPWGRKESVTTEWLTTVALSSLLGVWAS